MKSALYSSVILFWPATFSAAEEICPPKNISWMATEREVQFFPRGAIRTMMYYEY